MYSCPNCEKSSISLWMKLFLSPGVITVKCPQCHQSVCAAYGGRLKCWIPLIMSLAVMQVIPSHFLALVVFLCGAFLSSVWVAITATLITEDEFMKRKSIQKHSQSAVDETVQ